MFRYLVDLSSDRRYLGRRLRQMYKVFRPKDCVIMPIRSAEDYDLRCRAAKKKERYE
jgi:hypothetical protein